MIFHFFVFWHGFLKVIAKKKYNKRYITPIDVDTNGACYVPLQIHLNNGQMLNRIAPCLLPDLTTIENISTNTPRYWPVEYQNLLTYPNNWNAIFASGDGIIYVKRRAGHISYFAFLQNCFIFIFCVWVLLFHLY